jgi:hypothetical protein
MRTNNGKAKNIIISVYFVLIIIAIFMATVFSAFADLTGNPVVTFFIIVFSFLFVFFLVHSVSKYFEYDSDGVNILVTNRGLLLSDYFNYNEKNLEFEKHNLISFKINNYLVYKTLVLYVKGKQGGKKKVSFNITLVNKKKMKYIKQSLSKMVKHNIKQNKLVDDRG